jgi:aminoglycoside/choline kinase family phosphotransferase
LLLLEDLGDDTYARLLRAGKDERSLYELATDTLIEIRARLRPEALSEVPAFDIERALREVKLLLDWYWPAHFGAPASPIVASHFEEAWRKCLAHLFDVGKTLTLFDYHIDNLLLLPGRAALRSCGLLDFQDAVAGPTPFDLASLLEDVRRNVEPDLARAMIDRYLGAHIDIDRERFLAVFALCAAQRNTRIVGTFARLLKRDGKPQYQLFIPRVWRLLAKDLEHSELAPVALWFDRHLPLGERTVLTHKE